MNDSRYESMEARLTALERDVRYLLGAQPGSPDPGAATPAKPSPVASREGGPVEDRPVAASFGAAAFSDRAALGAAHGAGELGTGSAAAAPPPRSEANAFETLVAGRGLQIAGLILVLLGAAFFIDLACTRGWLGPTERILLGLAVGSGLIAFASARVRGSYRALGDALIGLGAGIDYLSLWAAIAIFPELHVPRAAGFAAMIAVTAVLGALAGVRRSQAIAILGIFGGLATPALLSGGPLDRVVLAAYLVALSGGMLAIARRYRFAAVEVLGSLGLLAYAGAFAPDPDAGWSTASAEIVAGLFAAVCAVAFSFGSPESENARKRRVGLLVVDASAFVIVLEQMFSDHQHLLGYNLLGFAALLLVTAQIPKLHSAFARVYGYLGLATVTLAVPAFLSSLTLYEALAVEGVLLFVFGLRTDRWIARAGFALIAFSGFVLFVETWLEPPSRALQIDIGLAIWLAGAAYVLPRVRRVVMVDSEVVYAIARIGVDAFALNALSRVCLDVFGGPFWNQTVPSHAQFALSIAWTLYASALFGYGLRRRTALLRWEGIALFAATILKVFTVDLSSVDIEYRIGSFVGLGIVLFAASAWYTRTMANNAPGSGERS